MLSNVSTYDQIDTIEVYPDAIQIHFGSSSSEPNDSTKPIVISKPETNEFPSYNDPAYARKNKLDELPFLGKVYCGECGKAMHRGSINLEKWNPEWTERFTAYEASLQPLFSGGTLHHIGATSIRGLSAQPIIDMLFLVPDEAAVWSAVDTLVDQGYTYIGTERNTETLFTEGAKMYVSHTPEPDPLIFRDILSSDPRVMWAYKQVKESAAPRGELAYNAAKGNFVEAVIRAYKQGRHDTTIHSSRQKEEKCNETAEDEHTIETVEEVQKINEDNKTTRAETNEKAIISLPVIDHLR